MQFPNWKNFIVNHPLTTVLMSKTTELAQIFEDNPDTIPCVNKLVKLPSSIVLTLDPFDLKVASFFHLQLEETDPFSTRAPRLFGLSGFGSSAQVVEFKTDGLTAKSAISAVPPLTSFLQFHNQTVEDLKSITATVNEAEERRSVNHATILPPALGNLFLGMNTNVSTCPWTVLLTMINGIGNTKPEGVEDDDVEYAKPFYNILLTLWAFTTPEELKENPVHTVVRLARDQTSINWGESIHRRHIVAVAQGQHLSTRTLQQNQHQGTLETGAAVASSALTRLAESIETQTNQLRSAAMSDNKGDDDEESKDPAGWKVWKKLDSMTQAMILRASSIDGFTCPERPTDRLVSILGSKSGMATARLFVNWHGSDMICQPGMATNICKGNFNSLPDEFAVNTFSILFCPPHRAGFTQLSNMDINALELASSSQNLTSGDIQKMTSTTIYVPNRPDFYEAQLQNWVNIISDVKGPNSIIYINTKELLDHYKASPIHYFRLFESHGEAFAAWILNMIHYKTQKFLRLCRDAEHTEDINFQMCSFSNEIASIDSLSFTVSTPKWYTDILAERKQASSPPNNQGSGTHHSNGNGGGSFAKRKSEKGNNNSRRQRVVNPSPDRECSVKTGESYAQLVHKHMLDKVTDKLTYFGDKTVCNNYHIRGYCFTDCQRSVSHIALNGDTLQKYRGYVRALRTVIRNDSGKGHHTSKEYSSNKTGQAPGTNAAANHSDSKHQGENTSS